MENQITIREAVLKDEITAFWERLTIYRNRNHFPASGAAGSWECAVSLRASPRLPAPPCDAEMYQALGFHTPLGKSFVHHG